MFSRFARGRPRISQLSADESEDRLGVPEQLKDPIEGANGVRNGHIPALGSLIPGATYLKNLEGDSVGQIGTSQCDSCSSADDIGRRYHDWTADWTEVFFKDLVELAFGINPREMGEDKAALPLEDLVWVPQQTVEVIKMRIQQLRLLSGQIAQHFGATVLGERIRGVQSVQQFLKIHCKSR